VVPRAQSYPALELPRGSALRNTLTPFWTFLSLAKALGSRSASSIFTESPSCYSLVLTVRFHQTAPSNFYLPNNHTEGTADMMDWAALHAKSRGAEWWKSFTTGKSARKLGGVPHDTYGMTSLSIRQYVLGIYKQLGLREKDITKVQTGGPDGDLGSSVYLSQTPFPNEYLALPQMKSFSAMTRPSLSLMGAVFSQTPSASTGRNLFASPRPGNPSPSSISRS